jgi:signal transduction histidine kinase
MLQEYQSIQPDQLGNMLALLVRNTRRLESLVSNLIDAAGLQNGKLQLRKSAATVQSLVRDAYDFVLPLLDAKHQRLETRTTGEPPVLTVDAKRIVGVLVNLLANANRYGVPNEPIQLLIANEGTFIRFTVRQKGPGIPKEEQALLFERFYRTSSGAAVSGGSGLGLAIVKDIVEMHGGTVGMHSKPGLTTAFWFTLPTDGSGGVA